MPDKEVEIKILEIDVDAVTQKLDKLGAELIFDDYMNAIFFDDDHKTMEKENKMLRLRKEAENCELVFKKVIYKEGIRVNEESTVEVGDFDKMREILICAGFKENYAHSKHRKEYLFNGLKIAIDTYEGNLSHIPTFLEIEGTDEKQVIVGAAFLGFRPRTFKNWTTRDLEKFYRTKI